MAATVRYLVQDVDRAIKTYVKAFGFTLVQQMGPAFAIVQRGDLELWLSGPLTSAAKPMPDGAKPVPGGWNRIVLVTEDIESEIETVLAQGIALRGELVRGPGGSQLVANDGEGNIIELFEPA